MLIGLLGAVFLKGLKEAIGVAVVLVVAYLAMNAVVVDVALYEVFTQPVEAPTLTPGEWWHRMLASRGGNPLLITGAALLLSRNWR